jgi:cytochrome c553
MIRAASTLALAAAIAAVAPAARAQNAAAGEKKAAMCIGCHGIPGYQSSFPEVYRVPKIAGQNAKFIAAALAAYKKGERRHPSMRGVAGSLTDQDMADLAAFYEKYGEASVKTVAAAGALPAPTAEVDALLKKGACASCHGDNYSKPIDPTYPKIGGQYGEYLYAALKAYRTEGNPNVGRAHPIMTAQVKQFSLTELKAMSKYIGSLPTEMRVVPMNYFR